MTDQIHVSDGQLAKREGVSKVTIWRWAKNNPNFPKPRKLSNGCTRWLLSEIQAWEASLDSGDKVRLNNELIA